MSDLTLLVVEDDDVDAECVARGLRKAKVEVGHVRVPHAEGALDLLRGESCPPLAGPFLVLLDLNLPGIDGVAFMEELRSDADSRLRDAVVFVLTTSEDPRDKAAAYRHRAAGFISKSTLGVDYSTLAELIDRFKALVQLPD